MDKFKELSFEEAHNTDGGFISLAILGTAVLLAGVVTVGVMAYNAYYDDETSSGKCEDCVLV